jgi:ribulose-5-phosphate 4-epimerase/fuculose-1-phosphate aldolase
MADAREEITRYARRLLAERLVHATAGNLSMRTGDGSIAMTPTALAYDTLEPEDVCIVSAAGERIDCRREPTSELPLHTRLYTARPELGAIIHTHSPAAMTMAVLGWRLPPILTGLVEAAGGDVRVAEYAPPGTDETADRAAAALAGRGACFLAHHGLVAVGADLARAFRAAAVTEETARVYLDARAQGVEVPELAAEEVARIAGAWSAQW